MNEALKIKWIWRFAKEEDAFWRKVIIFKYGADNLGWWSKKSPYPHRVGCWKFILAGLKLFKTLVHFQVRNGSRVLVSRDVWCGESSLMYKFPDLFGMARFKEAMVDQMFSRDGEHIQWDLSLLRSPNDWEEESTCNLLAKLDVMEVKPQGNDELVWPHDSKGAFNIKSFCRPLMIGLCVLFFLQQLFAGEKLLHKFVLLLGCHLRKSSNRGLF